MPKKYTDVKIVNLDTLTYAGNLENLKDLEDDKSHLFVHGYICDTYLVAKLITDYDPDYIVNLAAEKHVHMLKSIREGKPTVWIHRDIRSR